MKRVQGGLKSTLDFFYFSQSQHLQPRSWNMLENASCVQGGFLNPKGSFAGICAAYDWGFALDVLRKAMVRGIQSWSGGDKHKMNGRLTDEKKLKELLRADGTGRIWLWRRILIEQSKRDSEMRDTWSRWDVGNFTPLKVLLCWWIEFGAVEKRADSFGLSQARSNHSFELLPVKHDIFCSYSIASPFGCIFIIKMTRIGGCGIEAYEFCRNWSWVMKDHWVSKYVVIDSIPDWISPIESPNWAWLETNLRWYNQWKLEAIDKRWMKWGWEREWRYVLASQWLRAEETSAVQPP